MSECQIFNNFKYNAESGSIEGYSKNEIEEIRGLIESHTVIVLKGVFEKTVIKKIRKSIFDYMQLSEQSNPIIQNNVMNYFRRDDNPEKSAVKRIKQFMASFYWNLDIAGETRLMKAMSRLRNEIARLPVEYTLNGIEEDGYMTYSNVTHYPSGGGKLNKHQDPPNKQFTVIIASMSEKGDDFDYGGVYVEIDGKKIDLDDVINTGDVYLINPQMVHGVEQIDPQVKSLQWNSIKGRWILFPALIEVKTTQGIKVDGLRDLENDRR
jgi:hypothetical protein